MLRVVVIPVAVCLLCCCFHSLLTHPHLPPHSPSPPTSLTKDHSSVLAADEVLTVQKVLKTKGQSFSEEQVGVEGRGRGGGGARGGKGKVDSEGLAYSSWWCAVCGMWWY